MSTSSSHLPGPGPSQLAARARAAVQSLVIGPDALTFAESLGHAGAGIVVAEPGAGKTTGVPLALLASSWLSERADPGVVIVEPRRVAARQAATRMASMLGEQISGRTTGHIGLRSRDDTAVGAQTRVEVVTDGVLPRMLRSDPGLAGRSVVIFDEFHERSLDTDLGLALTLSAQALLRPDLVVIVMSATLDTDRVRTLLEQHVPAPIETLRSSGRTFPVSVSSSVAGTDLADRVVRATVDAVTNRAGDVLVFLPGVHEINVCSRRLRDHPALTRATVLALHARGNPTETADALRPSRPGEQRVVLATSLAQTSVTIDGVTTVIDAGFIRRPVRDSATGMTRLSTERISQATATQRAGRAGRTAPGHAVQLWSAAEGSTFASDDAPAIRDADLTGLALAAADWGVAPTDMAWTDPPSEADWETANETLRMLGAIDASGNITDRGRRMAAVPAEPRIAALVADEPPDPAAGALAAYLSDSDWFGADAPVDLRARLAVLLKPGDDAALLTRGAGERFARARSRFVSRSQRSPAQADTVSLSSVGALALQAFPERLAVRSDDAADRYVFANGLVLPIDRSGRADTSAIVGAQMIVAVDMDSDRRRGVIRVAASVGLEEVRDWAARTTGCSLTDRVHTAWADGRLDASMVTELLTPAGVLTISRRPATPDHDSIARAVDDLLTQSPDQVTWTDAAAELWARMTLARQWLAGLGEADWPNLTRQWAADVGINAKRFTVDCIDVHAALRHHLDVTSSRRLLDELTPGSVSIGGRTVHVRYATDSGRPTIRARVQELFGTAVVAPICNGTVRLTIELLSPAGRVVGVTDDLGRFWNVGYPGLRADLRGRYPKHRWPEDPLTAAPNEPRAPR